MDQLGCYAVMDASLMGIESPSLECTEALPEISPVSRSHHLAEHEKLKRWIIRVCKALFEIFIHPLTMLLIKSSKLNKLKAVHAVRVCYPFTHPFIDFIGGRDHSRSRTLWHLGERTANLPHIVRALCCLANNHPMLCLHTRFFISSTASSPCTHKGSAPGARRHTACTGILCSF